MKYFYTNIFSHVLPCIKEIVIYKMKFDEGPNNMHTIMSVSKETLQETDLGKLGILVRAQM